NPRRARNSNAPATNGRTVGFGVMSLFMTLDRQRRYRGGRAGSVECADARGVARGEGGGPGHGRRRGGGGDGRMPASSVPRTIPAADLGNGDGRLPARRDD